MRVFVLLMLLLSAGGGVASDYPFAVVRVLDGDTVDGDVQIWPGLTQRIRVRVHGVDTPEIHTRDACEKRAGYRAKSFVEQWVGGGAITLRDVQLGKYAGRVVGRLVREDGRDLSQDLLSAGLAVPYLGKTKQPFVCRE